MNIIITGASGFVGTRLTETLLAGGHTMTGIGTSRTHPRITTDKLKWIPADTTRPGPWQDAVPDADVIINLTGKNIFGYWTKRYKLQIYHSRILTTKHIVDALPKNNHSLLLNTSAIGYYGDGGEALLTEDRGPGNDFLASVCIDWEKESIKAEATGCRVVRMRFGVVLGKNGGALVKMLPAFKYFAGGPLGRGLHWFPWIHMDDLVGAILFLMDTPNLSGPFNFCAPEAVRQKTFAKTLGNVLNRPSIMPAPAFMMKLLLGEMSHALMSSQKGVPQALTQAGFQFKFPCLKPALQEILT
ncbi:TIGR01777 family oxidoreductase [Desulfocicer niacini]